MPAAPLPSEKPDRPAPSAADPSEKRLWGWFSFSFVLHVLLISTLFLAPSVGQRRISPMPVYTVELVGGERLGGTTTVLEAPAAQPKPEKKAKSEPPPAREPPEKKTKKPPEPALAKPKEKPPEPPAPKAKDAMKEIEKPVEQAEPAKGLSEEARERLIQAALESVKRRVSKSAQKPAAEATVEKKAARENAGPPVLSGPGEGVGAAAPGEGGTGGGIVKGVEFIVYRNRMLQQIKQRWTWIGKRSDLEVAVRFAIQDNGEISGLKIIQGSGDASFDNSVLRAVRNASPLGAPPEKYRADFRDVELTFRPRDLQG